MESGHSCAAAAEVAVGSEMLKDMGYKPGSEYEFDVPYIAEEGSVETSGVQMFAEILAKQPDESVTSPFREKAW